MRSAENSHLGRRTPSRELLLGWARPHRAEGVAFALLGVAALVSLALAAAPLRTLLVGSEGGPTAGVTTTKPVAKRPVARLSFWWGQAKADGRSLAAACRYLWQAGPSPALALSGDEEGPRRPGLAGETNAAPGVPHV